ncbi:Helix-turn-helix domain-containing protein [Sinosporangium album]|uniref:Helix-turn-helix domain-containing protein n=1 Tax=Sinosporangium album TaxID=504805 RepID=A0A1G8AYH4_9ACTN|nr:helix-turn-helix transcriptional regulator [Sinosporangium album]SDH25863.1 Helix-turn-helix domain-containing protein [Sinosporangium album]
MAGGEERIGQRIAALRKIRRMTQRQVATQANISLSLLQKVEAGSRAATPVLVAAVAPVLRVSSRELYGQPFVMDQSHTAIPRLHASLARFDVLIPPMRPPRRAYSQLKAETDEVNRLRQAGNYTQLGERVPPLLDEIGPLIQGAVGVERERLGHLLALLYFAAHSLA